jgi:hypothetical protein
MDRNPNGRIDVDGHPENTDRELNMQPGRLEDIENAEAYAARTGERDVTGERPGRDRDDDRERLHVAPGESLGGRVRAEPADGLRGADGRINRGEDIGHGIRADPAETFDINDGRVEAGEDIGNGIRARRADEQDPGNPLV